MKTTVQRLAIVAFCVAMPFAASPKAGQETDQLREGARKTLQEPYFTEPTACHNGWMAGMDNYIVALEPWAEDAGLRRGDRIDVIQGESADGGWMKAMPRLRPDSASLELTVTRDGRTLDLSIPCRDHAPYLNAARRMLQTMAAGRWDDCLQATRDLTDAFGRPFATPVQAAITCLAELAKVRRLDETVVNDYWSMVHQFVTLDLLEDSFRPHGSPEKRAVALSAINNLERAGFSEYADDVRQQLAHLSASSHPR